VRIAVVDDVGLDESRLVGEHHRLHAVAKVELLQDVRDVGLHGRVADVELLSDLGVRESACDQAEDVSFPLGELVELGRRSRSRHARELLDHPLGDRGREEGVAACDGADGDEELFRRVILEDEPAGTDPECFVHVLVEVERGQDEDPGPLVLGQDPAKPARTID
jgi:hypothetical protein